MEVEMKEVAALIDGSSCSVMLRDLSARGPAVRSRGVRTGVLKKRRGNSLVIDLFG